jgi:RNA recognition motif-containing protein
MSSLARRGQAWVVFESIVAADAAQKALHGASAFGKKMRVSFSKNVSDITRLRKGLQPREKRSAPFSRKPRGQPAMEGRTGSTGTSDDFFRTEAAAPKIPAMRGYNPPNRILIAENLPEQISSGELSGLFGAFHGFLEARYIPTRGVAFIEFETEQSSQNALLKLTGPEAVSKIGFSLSYAKR